MYDTFIGNDKTRPPSKEIDIATKNPSCSFISIRPQSECPRSAIAEHKGCVKKSKMGFQIVKQIIMPIINATKE